jgi:hypothetical protein
MPSVLVKAVSDVVKSSQRRYVYHPARRSRALQQSKANKSKFEAAFNNESDPYGWTYTSNARVFPEYIAGVIVAWRICARRRRLHPKNRKATERKSTTRYSTQIKAENEMYSYRKSLKPKSVQSQLNQWEQRVTNLAVLTDPTSFSIVDQSSTQVIIKTDTAANKRHTKSIAMSSNTKFRKASGIECRNPKLPPVGLLQFTQEQAVLRVQRYVRKRQLLRPGNGCT